MKNQTLLALLSFFPMVLSAQWTRTNGLNAGYVVDQILIGDTIVANAGELYYSIDRGDHWAMLANSPGDHSIELRYSEGELLLKSYSHNYINTSLWRSQDIGQTWTEVKLIDSMLVYEFYKVGLFIYISDYYGLYRSSDNGVTWDHLVSRPINQLCSDGSRLTALVYDETTQFNQVIQSTDGGIVWSNLFSFPENGTELFQHENYFFIFMSDLKYCWYSPDYGATWIKRQMTIPFNNTSGIQWNQGTIMWANYGTLFFSHDLGLTWGFEGINRFEDPIVSVLGIQDTIFIGNSFTGISRKTNSNATWERKNEGLVGANPVRFTSAGNNLYASYATGLSKIKSNGLDWNLETIDIPTPSGAYIGEKDYLELEGRRLVVHGWNILLKKSQSNGWQKAVIETPDSLFEHFYRLELINGGILSYSYTGNHFFVSTNQGDTFHPIFPSTQNAPILMNSYFVDAGSVYILDYDNRLFRSNDGGQSWLHVLTVPAQNCPLISNSHQLFIRDSSVFVFPRNPHVRRLLFSPNMGAEWQCFDLTEGERPWGVARIWDLKKSGPFLFLVTSAGIFVSKDKGQNWTDWNEGLKGKITTSIGFHGQYIWAGCQGYGVWKRLISELSTISETEDKATNVKALTVYPNPVLDFCTFNLPEKGVLNIWDVIGQLVSRMDVTEGECTVDLSQWPPGVYRVLLSAENGIYEVTMVRVPK